MESIERQAYKVSVIVPVYNVERYLRGCVGSILNQSYRNLEVILVDDGSPDECGKLCDELAAEDERVIVIHKQNGGLSDARNKALEIASGDMIGFVDGDDRINPHMYETLIDAMLQHDSDISICKYRRVIEGETPPQVPTCHCKAEFMDNFTAMRELILDDKVTSHACNKLFRASLLSEIRFPVGVIFEDIAIMHEVFSKAKGVAFVDCALYDYLDRKDSTLHRIDPISQLNYFDAYRLRYEFVKRSRRYEALADEALTKAILSGLLSARQITRYEKKQWKPHLKYIRRFLIDNKRAVMSNRAIGLNKKARALCMMLSVTLYKAIDTRILQRTLGVVFSKYR